MANLRDIQKCAIDVGKIAVVTCGQIDCSTALSESLNLTAYICGTEVGVHCRTRHAKQLGQVKYIL
ncbi:hypothetical protein D3C75_1048430 [compost metagenome]